MQNQLFKPKIEALLDELKNNPKIQIKEAKIGQPVSISEVQNATTKNGLKLPQDIQKLYQEMDGMRISWSPNTEHEDYDEHAHDLEMGYGWIDIQPLQMLIRGAILSVELSGDNVDERGDKTEPLPIPEGYFGEDADAADQEQIWYWRRRMAVIDQDFGGQGSGAGSLALDLTNQEKSQVWLLGQEFNHIADSFDAYFNALIKSKGIYYWQTHMMPGSEEYPAEDCESDQAFEIIFNQNLSDLIRPETKTEPLSAPDPFVS
jgi:hypothetical protein